MEELKALLPLVKEFCYEAANVILAVYNKASGITVQQKIDLSPVTQADLKAHQILYENLSRLPVVEGDTAPVLSEEGDKPDYSVRKKWHTYWLIDPLDGTKEFLGKTGEFTINVALIHEHEPVLGLVYVPCQQLLYYAIKNEGAFKQERNNAPCSIYSKPYAYNEPLSVLVSRRHTKSELNALFLSSLIFDVTFVGSALKMCWIAEAKADCYPRLGPTSEWDTAAAQCILREAGGEILDFGGQPLRYNQKSSLLNPPFIAVGDPHFNWQSLFVQPA